MTRPRILAATYGHTHVDPSSFRNSVLLTMFGSVAGCALVGEVTDLSPKLVERGHPEAPDGGVNWTRVGQMASQVTSGFDVLFVQAGAFFGLDVMRAFREQNPRGVIIAQRDSTHAATLLGLMRRGMVRHHIEWEHWYERDGGVNLRRDCEEYAEADFIFTLSKWVTSTFLAYAQTRGKVRHFSSQLSDERLWTLPPDGWASRPPRFTACAVGSMGIRKGTLDLLDAWEIFWGRHPDARLLLAGETDGAEPDRVRDEVLRRIAESPATKRYGWTPPPHGTRAVYHASHVFVTAAIEEGSTMPGVEAPMCGLPIIATPNAGIDLLEHRRTGWVVPMESPHEFADALCEAYDAWKGGTLEAMGLEARHRATTIGEYAEGFAAKMREVLA